MSQPRPADWLTMVFESPSGRLEPIAVLLLDLSQDRLYVRTRRDCRGLANSEITRVLEIMLFDLAADAREQPGSAVLLGLEGVLSNAVRLSARSRIAVEDFPAALEALFRQEIGSETRS
jgi:hypothetical protein